MRLGDARFEARNPGFTGVLDTRLEVSELALVRAHVHRLEDRINLLPLGY